MQSNATRLDFRSDTVTRPTPQMRAAMGAAKVSDDVLGDDFTVKALEGALPRCSAKKRDCCCRRVPWPISLRS